MRPWYEQAFGDFYLQLYAHRDESEARRVLDLLFSDDELRGRRVLDLACGAGRYLPALRQKGALALGMDLSTALLGEARSIVPDALLARADMRRLPLRDHSVDWLLSLFTSFGYFEDLDAHYRLASEWARVVTSGIVLDVPNPRPLQETLVPVSQRESGDRRVEERRRIEHEPLRVVKTVRVSDREGASLLEYEERVMLFAPQQLKEIFEAAGMRLEAAYGDYDASPFEEDSSPRQLLKYSMGDGRP